MEISGCKVGHISRQIMVMADSLLDGGVGAMPTIDTAPTTRHCSGSIIILRAGSGVLEIDGCC